MTDPLWGTTYYQRVLRTRGESLIGYWPLWDPTGSATAVDLSTRLPLATHAAGVSLTGQGIGDGRSPAFYAATHTNIYSTALNAEFVGAEGTAVAWVRVANSGVWTDATERRAFNIRVDINNFVTIRRTATNNNIQWAYTAGAAADLVSRGGLSLLDWFLVGITWSAAANEMRAFFNGVQTGATQTALGVWAGALASAECCIGARNTSATTPWSGWVAHVAVWNTPLSALEINSLARVV